MSGSAQVGDERHPYQYVVLRCVPRVDREEFINTGVVLFCPDQQFLGSRLHCDVAKVRALAPDLDIERVAGALAFVDLVCAGSDMQPGDHRHGGSTANGPLAQPISARFGFLKAPRSTVIQPGPVHGGRTADPVAELDRLFRSLVA